MAIPRFFDLIHIALFMFIAFVGFVLVEGGESLWGPRKF